LGNWHSASGACPPEYVAGFLVPPEPCAGQRVLPLHVDLRDVGEVLHLAVRVRRGCCAGADGALDKGVSLDRLDPPQVNDETSQGDAETGVTGAGRQVAAGRLDVFGAGSPVEVGDALVAALGGAVEVPESAPPAARRSVPRACRARKLGQAV
jgi:hypothetical protein